MVQGADVAKFYFTLGTHFSHSSIVYELSTFYHLVFLVNGKWKYLLEMSAQIELSILSKEFII